jgi:hypothetical protein
MSNVLELRVTDGHKDIKLNDTPSSRSFSRQVIGLPFSSTQKLKNYLGQVVERELRGVVANYELEDAPKGKDVVWLVVTGDGMGNSKLFIDAIGFTSEQRVLLLQTLVDSELNKLLAFNDTGNIGAYFDSISKALRA